VRAKAEAQALGVNLTVTGPTDFSASEQAPILNAVAVSKPDTLIVAPTDSSVLNPELSRIAGEGVKLVFVDTTTTDPSLAVSHITTNNVAGGALAADSLAQQIGGKGTVAVIDVNPGISTTDARIQGARWCATLWRWELTDAAGRPNTDHQVRLDAASRAAKLVSHSGRRQ
jgi:ribose transport system substrate-binding protein